MTSSARSSGLAALLLVMWGAGGTCVACSGSSASAAASNTSPDQAHLAAQASDPRTQGPTAVQGGPSAPAAPARTAPAPAPVGDANASKTAAEVRRATETETDPPTKITARHVLVQWMGCERTSKSVLRTREQALVLIEEVQRRARAGEDLGRLAVEYSDEPNAGARGGSLGRFSRGQMVGAFETAVFKLKVGEISDMVETPFGFHIIQRTE